MSVNLKYTVDPTSGVVLKVESLEGELQTIQSRAVRDLPWKRITRDYSSRWLELKRLVSAQTPGFWFIYDGFVSKVEIKRAVSALRKYKTDPIMKDKLNGHKLTFSINQPELKLAVKVNE